MKWFRRTAAATIFSLIAALVALPFAAPNQAAAATAVVRDGSTSATAAGSCWEIKQKFPAKPSGAYWLQTPTLGAPQQFFCDQEFRGGGWVLIGRGRDGWTSDYAGIGNPNNLLTRTRQPAQFAAVQLASQTIDGLMNGGRVDAMSDGILLHRAANTAGTAYNDINFNMTRGRWVWTFDAAHPLLWTTYDGGPRQSGGRSHNFGIDDVNHLVITTFLKKNSWRGGWATGGQVRGNSAATSYSWSPTNGNNPLPYSELYIRPQVESTSGYTALPNTGLAGSTQRVIANSYALPGQWGVTTGFPGTAGSEGNTPVQTFEQIGNTMFVGGNFTRVQKGSAGTETIAQAGLAAFNATTGEPITTFRPTFNNAVRSVAKLPNGLLAVGGDFTTVNGQPRAGLVVLNASTGGIAAGWTAVLQNRLTDGIVRIHDVEVGGNYLYLSGAFTHMAKSPGAATVYTRNAGRIYWPTASPDGSWNPEFSGTVNDGEVSDDGAVFWAAGWFDRSQGTPSFRAAAVSTAPGAALVLDSTNKFRAETWSDQEANRNQFAVLQVGNRVYFGGSQHSLFGFDIHTLDRVSGTVTGYGGDFQAIAESKGVLYAGCHCNDWSYQDAYDYKFDPLPLGWTEADKISWFGAWDAASGKRLPTFQPPSLASSNGGTWALFAATDGTIWSGGDFVGARTGPSSSQWVGGFVRFPEIDTVAPSTPTGFTQTATTTDNVTLAWQGEAGVTYEIFRDDRIIATTTAKTLTVARGGNDRFFIRAVDAAGNRSATTSVLTLAVAPAPLIARNASWSYNYTLAAPPTTWRQPAFDDSAWQAGAAPLGWGGNDVATNLDRPATERARTIYFRKDINLTDPASLGTVNVSVVADDGVVVHMNGTELGRVRMPTGAITHNTNASANIGYAAAHAAPVTFQVPASLLRTGVNTIAVETHLNYLNAPSASFALTMTATQ